MKNILFSSVIVLAGLAARADFICQISTGERCTGYTTSTQLHVYDYGTAVAQCTEFASSHREYICGVREVGPGPTPQPTPYPGPTPRPTPTPYPNQGAYYCQLSSDYTCQSWRHSVSIYSSPYTANQDCQNVAYQYGEYLCAVTPGY